IRGFGKDLFDIPNHYVGQTSSAWANLATAQYQEWQLGVDFSMPLGFRKGHTAVRNAELQLARERAILNEQERQVVVDLSNAFADLNRAQNVVQSNYNRRVAVMEQLKALEAVQDRTNADQFLLLDAQRKLADAESLYYRSLVEYEIGIKNIHYEKGSILEYNGVYLQELPSPAKAYADAIERIKLRTRPARWAEDGARTRVMNNGLVQQDFSGGDISLPARPIESSQPGSGDMAPEPAPAYESPEPLPQETSQSRPAVTPTAIPVAAATPVVRNPAPSAEPVRTAPSGPPAKAPADADDGPIEWMDE
ncbi:MAG: TolC family protein, partial [Planctomycetes bacterium]|nr:TolC family protein [Planctomycetota bacterium]